MTEGFLIALEGIDGSGKSTIRNSLAAWIKERTGRDVILGQNPKQATEGVWATQIRSILQGESAPPKDPFEFQRFYVLDRSEDVHFKILPALQKGNFVVFDRYAFSTLAYGMLSDIPVERLIKLHYDVIGPAMIMARANIILDLDPAVALSRKSTQYDKPHFFEKTESLKKARRAYLSLAEHPDFKKSTFVIDANRPLAEIENDIHKILESMF